MITDDFWSKTAWTGGRKVDDPKFAFAKHKGVIYFMNDVIGQAFGSRMTESLFAEFVKSRTRNSGYVRTTDRIASSRNREKKKHEKEDNGEKSEEAENEINVEQINAQNQPE